MELRITGMLANRCLEGGNVLRREIQRVELTESTC